MERLPRKSGRSGLTRFKDALSVLTGKADANRVRSLSLNDPNGWGGETVQAGVAVNESSVLALSAAWACVNLLAGTIASLPLMVYRTGADGQRTPATDHPLYRLLHDSPNYDQTAMDFWEGGQAALELRGDLHARIEWSAKRDRVISLHPIYMPQVRRDQSGVIRYRWTENGRSFDETQENVFHVRGFGGSPLGGLSTLSHGRQVFGGAIAADRAAQKTFANGANPSGVLSSKDWLKKEQRDPVEKALQEKYTGALNAGRPMLLEGGMTWQQITMTPEDAQMLESRGFGVEEVCRLFGTPPHMIGHTSGNTSLGSSIEEQTSGFEKYTLRRRLKRIEQAIMKQLLTPADRAAGIVVEFVLEGLLRADSKGRSEFYQRMAQIGAMTINEIRKRENLPPVEGGDVPRMQSQNIPINMVNPPTLVGGGGQ